MGLKSFLSTVGHKALDVLNYLGTPAGQNTLQLAETGAAAIGTAVGGPGVGAGIAGISVLVNKGLAGVLKMEASAGAVGASDGTGLQKGAAVAALLAPQAQQLLKDLGYDNPTAEQIETIANATSKALADVVNSVPPPADLVKPQSSDVTTSGVASSPLVQKVTQSTQSPSSTGMVASR